MRSLDLASMFKLPLTITLNNVYGYWAAQTISMLLLHRIFTIPIDMSTNGQDICREMLVNVGKQLLKNKTPFIFIPILLKLYIEFCHTNTVVCRTGTYFQ